MKGTFVLLFAAYTTGIKRRDTDSGWRLCTLVKKLSTVEARRADAVTQVGTTMHVGGIDWVCVERPEQSKGGNYLFYPVKATRGVRFALRGKVTPILPVEKGQEFGDTRRRLEKNGFKPTLGRAHDAKPIPYRSDY